MRFSMGQRFASGGLGGYSTGLTPETHPQGETPMRRTVWLAAAGPDGERGYDEHDQREPGGDEETTADASREGVVIPGDAQLARPRGVTQPGRCHRGSSGLAAETARRHGPGHGTERGQSDRAADLLAGIEQAGG